jgi:hypothetical protein
VQTILLGLVHPLETALSLRSEPRGVIDPPAIDTQARLHGEPLSLITIPDENHLEALLGDQGDRV